MDFTQRCGSYVCVPHPRHLNAYALRERHNGDWVRHPVTGAVRAFANTKRAARAARMLG